MKPDKFTEQTYLFTAGLGFQHHYREFAKVTEAIRYAELLKRLLNTKQVVSVQRYAFTECDRVYWETIAFI